MKNKIEEITYQIINSDPDPVIKFLLLRDVLQISQQDNELISVGKKLNENKWVKLLQAEQWADGSWGRFHSQDFKLKQKIPTTEYGVRYTNQFFIILIMLSKPFTYIQ
ncbi:MAG: hypothetical protein FK731_04675 [Asgard group archaeon]|nr:hypothetical protein [Asgard group archaeon]